MSWLGINPSEQDKIDMNETHNAAINRWTYQDGNIQWATEMSNTTSAAWLS